MKNLQQIAYLCPDLHEFGGIGTVSRVALRALESYSAATGCRGQTWSYAEPTADNPIPQVAGWKTTGYAHRRKSAALMWGLRAGLNDARHTLVVVMHLHLAPVALPMIKRGARMALVLYGSEAWTPFSGLKAACLRRADILIAISAHTVRGFKAANPSFAKSEVVVCPLGVPDEELASDGFVPGEPFALIVSRISAAERHKGHDPLLELWPHVLKRFPAARLMIVGDGDDRVRLQQKAHSLGLDDSVVFLGRVDDATLQKMYRACAFFVMPSSRLEGFGLVFLEAMRAGKACIGGAGAAEEVIVHKETGLIVPAEDREPLLEAVCHLFSNPDLCAAMGRAGRERYARHFTDEAFHDRFLQALGLRAKC